MLLLLAASEDIKSGHNNATRDLLLPRLARGSVTASWKPHAVTSPPSGSQARWPICTRTLTKRYISVLWQENKLVLKS